MGHVGSKSKSLGQIVENRSVPSRGLIFNLILMKLGYNVCLDENLGLVQKLVMFGQNPGQEVIS